MSNVEVRKINMIDVNGLKTSYGESKYNSDDNQSMISKGAVIGEKSKAWSKVKKLLKKERKPNNYTQNIIEEFKKIKASVKKKQNHDNKKALEIDNMNSSLKEDDEIPGFHQ